MYREVGTFKICTECTAESIIFNLVVAVIYRKHGPFQIFTGCTAEILFSIKFELEYIVSMSRFEYVPETPLRYYFQ